jgi:hypothetical protein
MLPLSQVIQTYNGMISKYELEMICKEAIMVLSKQISKYSVELYALQQI